MEDNPQVFEPREVSFNLRDYAALDYGYDATVHKAQGATVDRAFVLATPSMDRHLGYVGMTPHRDGAELYAWRDDFTDFDELKDRLSRARPGGRERTADAAAAGAEAASVTGAEVSRPGEKTEVGQGDPIARYKQAQMEFLQVAGTADFDPKVEARASDLREEMKNRPRRSLRNRPACARSSAKASPLRVCE